MDTSIPKQASHLSLLYNQPSDPNYTALSTSFAETSLYVTEFLRKLDGTIATLQRIISKPAVLEIALASEYLTIYMFCILIEVAERDLLASDVYLDRGWHNDDRYEYFCLSTPEVVKVVP
ncbi:hypothetical protein POM88_018463 [Heracleum sosnowskyi]|uniref:Uncharacterized protein n=1 Tax=Heracleum sosnowskyi TaxID=360622 RepID=A0AAD8MUR8_9APIA|nr:hypothetical protein POM88_018463 [Heracleum sosnowskyi]